MKSGLVHYQRVYFAPCIFPGLWDYLGIHFRQVCTHEV